MVYQSKIPFSPHSPAPPEASAFATRPFAPPKESQRLPAQRAPTPLPAAPAPASDALTDEEEWLQAKFDAGAAAFARGDTPQLSKPSGSVPPVQRYKLVNYRQEAAGDEKEAKAGYVAEEPTRELEEKGMFRSQSSKVTDKSAGGTTTYRIDPDLEQYSKSPNLKVADTDEMAIENTENEPKVFFATVGLLRESQAILDKVESRSTLREAGGTIKLGAKVLYRLEPVLRNADAEKAFENISDHCHRAAAEIVGKTKAVLQSPGSAAQETKTGNAFQIASELRPGAAPVAAAALDEKGAPALEIKAAEPAPMPEMTKPDAKAELDRYLDIAPEVEGMVKYVDKMWPWQYYSFRKHKPANMDWPLYAAAHLWRRGYKPEITDADLKAKYEEYAAAYMWRKDRAYRIDNPDLVEVYDLFWAEETTKDARREIAMRGEQGEKIDRDSVLSVQRRYAKLAPVYRYMHLPEAAKIGAGVNEGAMPEVGESFASYSLEAEAQDKDTSKLSADMFDPEKAYKKTLKDLAKELDAAKPQDTPWNQHHAAVVARSGGDAVTLENYNRADDAERILKKLQKDFEQISGMSFISMEKAVEKLQELGVKVRVAGESAAQQKTQRWFFQMYGSKPSQTFHEAWTKGGFLNPISLRRGREVKPEEKKRVGDWLEKETEGAKEKKTVAASLQRLKLELEGANTLSTVARIELQARRVIDAGE